MTLLTIQIRLLGIITKVSFLLVLAKIHFHASHNKAQVLLSKIECVYITGNRTPKIFSSFHASRKKISNLYLRSIMILLSNIHFENSDQTILGFSASNYACMMINKCTYFRSPTKGSWRSSEDEWSYVPAHVSNE